MKRLPTLVKNVTDALGQILSPAERDAAIESLWVIHAALLRSDPNCALSHWILRVQNLPLQSRKSQV